MKNKLFKTLLTFAVFAISVIGFSCVAHAADVEIIPSDDGNILKIHTEKSRDLSKIEDFARNHSYNHIIVTGKMDYYDFLTLSLMSSKCKSIDIYGVETRKNEIPASTFRNNVELEKFVLPANLKVIREYAFMDCPNLKEVIFPKSLECIANCAFENCWSLQLTVPDNVIVLPHAFGGCQHVTFPKSEIIGDPEDEISESSNSKQKRSLCSCI